MDILLAGALVALLFIALASGLWIGTALLAVGLVAMEFATSRPVDCVKPGRILNGSLLFTSLRKTTGIYHVPPN